MKANEKRRAEVGGLPGLETRTHHYPSLDDQARLSSLDMNGVTTERLGDHVFLTFRHFSRTVGRL